MAQAVLDHILEEIKTLEPDELRQVQRAVEEQLMPGGYSPQEYKALQAMVDAGLLKEIKPRRTTPRTPRRLIQVQGKLVSETIVEERR